MWYSRPIGATKPLVVNNNVTCTVVGVAHEFPQSTMMLTSPFTLGICVNSVALTAHRGAGLTLRRGAAWATAFSIETGCPDSQDGLFEFTSCVELVASMDPARAPAVAPS